MASQATDNSPMTLLFSCIGRRVELVQAFRAAAARLGQPLRVIGADSSPTAPALACADAAAITPPIADDGYVDALLSLIREHQVTALIPTIDTELEKLSHARRAFEADGCTALIADPDVIEICGDKIRTFEFLRTRGIDTPTTWTPEQVRELGQPDFPYFIKPRFGSASMWVHKIEDQADLDYYLNKVCDPIVQNYVDGVEHTLDVYVGLSGVPRCVVPRARRQVRGGEVSKGIVVKNRAIMEAGRNVVAALGPSVRGLVTLQCIVTPDERIRFIEINPRFGGGAPLGIAAGADYPGWLIQELRGETPEIAFDGFRDGLCMLRYDWSVFAPTEADGIPRFDEKLREPPRFD